MGAAVSAPAAASPVPSMPPRPPSWVGYLEEVISGGVITPPPMHAGADDSTQGPWLPTSAELPAQGTSGMALTSGTALLTNGAPRNDMRAGGDVS